MILVVISLLLNSPVLQHHQACFQSLMTISSIQPLFTFIIYLLVSQLRIRYTAYQTPSHSPSIKTRVKQGGGRPINKEKIPSCPMMIAWWWYRSLIKCIMIELPSSPIIKLTRLALLLPPISLSPLSDATASSTLEDDEAGATPTIHPLHLFDARPLLQLKPRLFPKR